MKTRRAQTTTQQSKTLIKSKNDRTDRESTRISYARFEMRDRLRCSQQIAEKSELKAFWGMKSRSNFGGAWSE